jgi:uncharacterized Fe-S radical SAM superfamily protein PflX
MLIGKLGIDVDVVLQQHGRLELVVSHDLYFTNEVFCSIKQASAFFLSSYKWVDPNYAHTYMLKNNYLEQVRNIYLEAYAKVNLSLSAPKDTEQLPYKQCAGPTTIYG